jgi:Domain of unknown function (DUF4386)
MNMIDNSQRIAAKVVGFLYLFTNATAMFAFSVRGKLIAARDAEQTAANIMASERLFRIGIAAELVTVVGVLVLVWGLYVILRPVDKSIVWLATFFRLGENFILAFATLLELAVLALVKGPASLEMFRAQEPLLVNAVVRVYGDTFNVGFLFLGLGSALFSYLWFKSRYIPRVLAGWGIFASLVMALMSLAIIVFPTLSKLGLTYMMPMGLYEFGLGLWLLIKGIQAPPPEIAPAPAGPMSHRMSSIPH